jgi:hypothetical protein
MYYLGLDIHTKRISICILNETGQLVRRCQVRSIEDMLGALKGLPNRFEVCYEASCGYGHYHDLLQPLPARVRARLLPGHRGRYPRPETLPLRPGGVRRGRRPRGGRRGRGCTRRRRRAFDVASPGAADAASGPSGRGRHGGRRGAG